ncbi:MAG: insulinase family protein [Prevotellaceae bacterium]|jgi:predicted Zn-dependent peptidase|nr:insulinase family protein [Prevotellaceae bacterium]
MKKIKLLLVLMVAAICLPLTANAQGLKAFKLPNGLSVFVWEDSTKAEVFGMVTARVGSRDEPEEYTGLAHYLEHVMFKGTQKIGALDWAKEKPVYDSIIAMYDEMAGEKDPAGKKEISKEINRLTIEASKVGAMNEFSSLTQSIGGINLNAFTSYDMTSYHNSFPPNEIYKWLDLNSERFINPVFRAFQPELETVYEEYNMYQDMQQTQVRKILLSNMFGDHPYAREVIGLGEHLKNPRLSQLIKFYDDWYVPENMALILVGNVKVNEILPTMREKFGRLERRAVPQRKEYVDAPFKGRKEVSASISRLPQLMLAYQGIPGGYEELITLDVCVAILSNESRTGLLDKIAIKGDVIAAYAETFALKDAGRILVGAVPYYDVNQHRFESLKSTEKMLLAEIKKLQQGEFEESLVESIKGDKIRQYDLEMESSREVASKLMNVFVFESDLSLVLSYKDIVASITPEQIKEVAQKYLGENYIAVQVKSGKPKKGKKIDKPDYDPIESPRNAKSDYATLFDYMPVKRDAPVFANMDEVEVKQINDRSKLFYTKNPENDVFTLMLKYGIGKEKMPKLELATQLMENAGVMGQFEAEELKKFFSALSTSCRYYVDDSYLYIVMEGFETYLKESCNLLTRQILLPKLDDKQLDNLKGQVYQMRMTEKDDAETLSDAMLEYLLYGEESEYVSRMSMSNIINLNVSNLTGEIQRATNYEAEIHYVGSLPLDTVYDILSKNLPLKSGELESTSPEVKPTVEIKENVIYFLPNRDAKQSSIYFYIEGDNYGKDIDVCSNAFNQYFGGGFNGLVLQEVREYRSMAYTAVGGVRNPPIPNKKSGFLGYVGTQADNTAKAVDVFMGLLVDMPEYPERMDNIKNYLRETAYMSRPEFRNASNVYQSWRLRGYEQAPAKENIEKIEQLTFEDIKSYYEKHIKGRKIAIGIVGDPKHVDLKSLGKYGKIVKLTTQKVLSEKKED